MQSWIAAGVVSALLNLENKELTKTQRANLALALHQLVQQPRQQLVVKQEAIIKRKCSLEIT
jgi:hypothetical protein